MLYDAEVRRLTRERNEAAVKLLLRTVRGFGGVDRVGVFEDTFPVPVWTRPVIFSLAAPSAYREHEAFHTLVGRAAMFNVSIFPVPLGG